ncbi:YolD-like family protein [Macrococcoides canis]|uniref:YolD-like family protein n=1 Tax=Macrococcoides canis TaxID=1855823 RepID=A0AAE6X2K7_9STAP|nr:YolD-like family protein [Macrococcus canis]QIH78335.1 YolD-like family protein [Macrococcus canis]
MNCHNLNPTHPLVPSYLIEETDYRNIPAQYLERKIPKGRGMIKWSPFATMPQQYADIKRQIQSQDYVYMPVLSDEQIADINIKLHHYSCMPSSCTILYHEKYQLHEIDCVVEKIDEFNQEVQVRTCYDHEKICLKFKYIVEIR